jgi:hypothetical protein
MSPKVLGGLAALLVAAFLVALPTVFGREAADEVEPIRFGPPIEREQEREGRKAGKDRERRSPGRGKEAPTQAATAAPVAPAVGNGTEGRDDDEGGHDDDGGNGGGGLGSAAGAQPAALAPTPQGPVDDDEDDFDDDGDDSVSGESFDD